jgi:hypothetical protein
MAALKTLKNIREELCKIKYVISLFLFYFVYQVKGVYAPQCWPLYYGLMLPIEVFLLNLYEIHTYSCTY